MTCLMSEHGSKILLIENISEYSPIELRMSVKWFTWILKIQPKFQVLTFHFSWTNNLLDEH